jgi:hypothetical protein
LAAAIEKAMGIDPADRFQNADDFKRALLGTKTKTQLLPGDYVVEPPPADAIEEFHQNAVEKSSKPPADRKSGNHVNESGVSSAGELPVFKPRRRKERVDVDYRSC